MSRPLEQHLLDRSRRHPNRGAN